MGPFLFILLAVAVALGAFYVSYQMKLARQRAFAAVAARLGLRYSPDDAFNLDSLPFDLFGKGDGRACENVMFGTWQGNDVKTFDYWYRVRNFNGKTTSTTYYRFSCALVALSFDAPQTTIGPESILTRAADLVGIHDIEFESKEFNDKTLVRSADRKFASYLIDARMMQWLLDVSGWHFELYGPMLLCYEHKVGPDDYPQILAAACEFVAHIPRVVHETYGSVR